MLRENIRGAGWGLALTWPLLTVQAAWLEVAWLGSLGALACAVMLVRDLAGDGDSESSPISCGGRCCAQR